MLARSETPQTATSFSSTIKRGSQTIFSKVFLESLPQLKNEAKIQDLVSRPNFLLVGISHRQPTMFQI